MDLVSVIVPVYNVENFLKRSVHSIVSQTYPELEIILVDDGSTDFSGAICDEFLSDFRIKVIHKQNGGLSDARNTGLDEGSGSFVFFLDSDDYLNTDAIETLMHYAKEERSDVVVFPFQKVDESGVPLMCEEVDVEKKIEVIKSTTMLDRITRDKYWWYVPAWNKLYRRKVWNDIRFPVGKLHEDEYVVHEVFGTCDSVVVISDQLLYYVQRDGSITKHFSDRNRMDKTDALINRSYYYLDHGFCDLAMATFMSAIDKYLIPVARDNKQRNSALRAELRTLRTQFSLRPFRLKDRIKIYIALYFDKVYESIIRYKLRGTRNAKQYR